MDSNDPEDTFEIGIIAGASYGAGVILVVIAGIDYFLSPSMGKIRFIDPILSVIMMVGGRTTPLTRSRDYDLHYHRASSLYGFRRVLLGNCEIY